MEPGNSENSEPFSEPPSKKAKVESDDGEPKHNASADKDPKDKPLMEVDVGIMEYISQHKGFNGVIKQRFSDFLVNEINLDGAVVRISDTAPIDKSDQVDAAKTSEKSDDGVLSAEWKTTLQKLLEEKNRLKEVFLQVGDDKEERTKIHNAIRNEFPGLESKTGEKDGSKCIIVTFCPGGTRGERRGKEAWPAGRGDFCHFTLYKENKDTMDAINVIARMLRIRPSMFAYAGTKDRRAKTCQRVSVKRVTSTRLEQLNRGLRGMAIGNFRYCTEPLRLGDLKGNQFQIILRSVDGNDSDMESGLQSLRDVGFINYFGMQRFGTTSVPTHHVGKALLQSKWSEAIELILQPRGDAKDHLSAARKVWSTTKDADAALRNIGRIGGIEQTLLLGIKKCGTNDYIGALGSLPRNTRLMYVHAYQSYIWNTVVSRRLQKFGLKVVEGDLVLKMTEKVNSPDKKPCIVSAETVDKYTIHDVVFPLPGWDIKYPTNVCGEWFQELLTKDGLSNEALKNKVKDYSLPGDYRHLVIGPDNVSWKFHRYDDVTKPLVLSDLERIRGETLTESEGQQKALEVQLTLPSSTYATMALREILKTDTSAGHQTTLNQ